MRERADSRLPRDCQETLIRIDHDARTVNLWTQNRGVIGKCKRNGWTLEKTQSGGFWFKAPARAVLIRASVQKPRQGGGFQPKSTQS